MKWEEKITLIDQHVNERIRQFLSNLLINNLPAKVRLIPNSNTGINYNP